MPEHMVHGSPDAGGGYTMTSFLSWLMSPQDYMPHGMYFLWQPELIALHVASAEEFLDSDRLGKTSCLILDVHMPGMNGLELQEHLVASSYSIPIIFITAFTDDRARVQALKAGAVGYLAKPFADEDLLNCIHAALKLPVPSTLQPRGQ